MWLLHELCQIFIMESDQALAQAVQGSAGVTIPRGI